MRDSLVTFSGNERFFPFNLETTKHVREATYNQIKYLQVLLSQHVRNKQEQMVTLYFPGPLVFL